MPPLSKMHQRVNKAVAGRGQQADTTTKTVVEMIKEQDPKLAAAMKELDGIKMPDNNFWDEPKAFYEQVMNALLNSQEMLVNEIQARRQDPVLGPKINSDPKLPTLVNAVANDLATQLGMLQRTYDSHKNRSGAITNPDDMLELLSVNEAYSNIMQVFTSIITPMTEEIMEIIGVYDDAIALAEQEKQREAEKAAQAAIDPTVITDIEVREVPAETQPVQG